MTSLIIVMNVVSAVWEDEISSVIAKDVGCVLMSICFHSIIAKLENTWPIVQFVMKICFQVECRPMKCLVDTTFTGIVSIH
mmetsp:Transcript_1058/g.1894  ORF Transcript_1058/g.1894 Transcript_1058/m.1894 type:complete len:81 (-) Transcript_1058:306-548(-)